MVNMEGTQRLGDSSGNRSREQYLKGLAGTGALGCPNVAGGTYGVGQRYVNPERINLRKSQLRYNPHPTGVVNSIY